jgi:hypothetical protein
MATRLPFSGEQYWNACKRNAFRGALMYTYQAGTTTTLKTTWTEADEAIEHPNPVIQCRLMPMAYSQRFMVLALITLRLKITLAIKLSIRLIILKVLVFSHI